MGDLLSSEFGPFGLIVIPGVIVALLALALTAKGLRGAAGGAVLAFLMALVIVLALGAAGVFGAKEYALAEMIPQCEAQQQAAHERGEALLLDCESEGLIVAFPVFSAGVALVVVLFGAAFIRMTRKR